MRHLVGGVGVAITGFGVWLLFGGGEVRDPGDVMVWLAGAIVLHDGLIAPLVFAVGLLLAALPARRTLRTALMTAGALTLVALPPLLRPGTPKNPSVLPSDYVGNWLLTLGAVAAATAAWLLLSRAARALDGRRMLLRTARQVRADAVAVQSPGARQEDDGAGAGNGPADPVP